MQPTAAPQDAPADMPQGGGPRATSGSPLFDTVAVAQRGDAGGHGVAAAIAGVAPGSFVEVTELGGGHTIVALVGSDPPAGGVVMLSEAALQALGIAPGQGVRVRAALPSPQDQTALRSGAAASARINAPDVLLKALRKRVPQSAMQSPPAPSRGVVRSRDDIAVAPSTRPAVRTPRLAEKDADRGSVSAPIAIARPVRPTPHAPPPAPRSGYVVQVAALSSAPRAGDLARSLHGRVVGGGGLYRVQLGPYGDSATANRARDAAARRGYRDAHVFRTE